MHPRRHLRPVLPLLILGGVLLSVAGCSSALIVSARSPAQSNPGGGVQQDAPSPYPLPEGEGSVVARLPLGSWDDFPSYPIPDGNPVPLGPEVFRSGFRDPLPASPVWNPPGPKRVGIQAGHWLTEQVPLELRRLSSGTSGGGWAEWQLALLIAQQTASILEDAGVQVDLLPTTIPVRYRAQAFIAIHADGDTSGAFHGYKIARPGFSSVPDADDTLVKNLYDEYGAATGLSKDCDCHISLRMLYYYAFNTRRYQHALDVGTPSAIIETGFLTNASDRNFLTTRPDLAAQGIANGVLRFLSLELGAREA